MGDVVHFRSAVALLGRFPALAGVDFEMAAGEVVLVEGPNGAGKTSLLRACAGLLPLHNGAGTVLGTDLRRDRRSVRRRVGLLGHASGLYDDLTVSENVSFAVRAAGGDVDTVASALERTGLTGRLPATPAARLSQGQRRRTALAALVARQPELWLLDEPHAGLDAAGRRLLDEVVGEAIAGGASVLFASHEAERARRLATRTITMAGGQVVAAPAADRISEPVHVA